MMSYEDYQDRVLTCRDCGQDFVFSAGEQAFYQEKGYNDPKRCKACRMRRKNNLANRQERRQNLTRW